MKLPKRTDLKLNLSAHTHTHTHTPGYLCMERERKNDRTNAMNCSNVVSLDKRYTEISC